MDNSRMRVGNNFDIFLTLGKEIKIVVSGYMKLLMDRWNGK